MTFRFQLPIDQLYLPTQIRGYPPLGVTSILKGLDQIIPGQPPRGSTVADPALLSATPEHSSLLVLILVLARSQ